MVLARYGSSSLFKERALKARRADARKGVTSTARTLEHGRNHWDTKANPMARVESFPGRVCDFLFMLGTCLPDTERPRLIIDLRQGVLRGEEVKRRNSDPGVHSCGKSVGKRGSLAGFDVTVVQSQSDQFLKAGIDLVVHGGILRGDIAEFLEQARAAVVVVALGILEPLAVVACSLLESLRGTGLRVRGSGPLHCLRTRCTRHSALASASLLLFRGGNARGRVFWRARSLGRGVVVNTTHVVEEVPSTGESISRDGSVASFEQAKVRVITMTVEPMSLTFVAEETGIG